MIFATRIHMSSQSIRKTVSSARTRSPVHQKGVRACNELHLLAPSIHLR